MNKVAVQRRILIIVTGIVLLAVILMIAIIPGVLHDTFPGAVPKRAAKAILVMIILHLPVLLGFLIAIRVNKHGGQVKNVVYISLGIVLLFLGLVLSDGAFASLAHHMLFVSILWFISVICDIVASLISFAAIFLKPKIEIPKDL